jgi:ferric-dicitrate binding protein FerR (iron transport regulator)
MSLAAIPSPPTDNLYKFAALLGVLIALAGPTYYVTQSTELQLKEVSAQQDVALYQKQIEWLMADISGSWHQVKPDANGRIPELSAEEQAAYREIFERRRNLELTKVKLEHVEKSVSVVRSQLRLLFWLMIGGLVVGVPLSVWGFRRWHQRVQKLQDLQLKNQAQNPKSSENA